VSLSITLLARRTWRVFGLSWRIPLDDFACIAIDDFRSFSRTRSGAGRPLGLIQPVRAYQPPASHANFESWLGRLHRIRTEFRTR
jgi:hypothetical protein